MGSRDSKNSIRSRSVKTERESNRTQREENTMKGGASRERDLTGPNEAIIIRNNKGKNYRLQIL